MYLSKISLCNSPRGREQLVHLGRNGAYAAHQLLWMLFPESEKREFLFREEQGPMGFPEFFVLSQQLPNSIPQLFNVQTKPFAPRLKSGDRLAYKLRVNPTICMKSASGKRQRHDVLMHAKRQAKAQGVADSALMQEKMTQSAQAWFTDERRLERWGAQLEMLPDVECYTQHQVMKSKERRIRFSSVDLQGVLTVAEPEYFIQTLYSGLGKAKAFGCGLMLVRRV